MTSCYRLLLIIALSLTVPLLVSNADAAAKLTQGQVITGMKAGATGGGGPFDGLVDSTADLDDLVATAWGSGWLGLHRGHRPIMEVLIAFLGITHEQMHYYMEEKDLNLAGVCAELGYDAARLVESLTNSFLPYVDEAVAKGIIDAADAGIWEDKIRAQFRRRVYWRG